MEGAFRDEPSFDNRHLDLCRPSHTPASETALPASTARLEKLDRLGAGVGGVSQMR